MQQHNYQWVISTFLSLECFDSISVLNFRSLNASKVLKCSHHITFSYGFNACVHVCVRLSVCMSACVWAMFVEWWSHALRAFCILCIHGASLQFHRYQILYFSSVQLLSPGNNRMKWYRNQVASCWSLQQQQQPITFQVFYIKKITLYRQFQRLFNCFYSLPLSLPSVRY